MAWNTTTRTRVTLLGPNTVAKGSRDGGGARFERRGARCKGRRARGEGRGARGEGALVEDEEGGLRPGDGAQHDAALLAATQLAHRLPRVLVLDAEAAQPRADLDLLGACARGVHSVRKRRACGVRGVCTGGAQERACRVHAACMWRACSVHVACMWCARGSHVRGGETHRRTWRRGSPAAMRSGRAGRCGAARRWPTWRHG